MPWSSKIIRQFRLIPQAGEAWEADFHGPYNKLLCSLFPANTDYSVFPHYDPGSFMSPNTQFFFDVLFDDKPVFILGHKATREFERGNQRDDGNRLVRERMEDLRSDCPLPVLHAVSAFGTRLCFYRMHRDQTIQPSLSSFIPRLPWGEIDSAPEEHWDCDIFEEEGGKRFKSMVEEIKQACAAL